MGRNSQKSIYSKDQVALQNQLKELREKAQLTQEGMAARLNRPQSFVSKYESGERRLDILELRLICQELGITLIDFIRALDKKLKKL